jgi:hypothetical protein
MHITDDVDLYRTFWVSSQGEINGPFTLEQIGEMWRSGRIYATAQACEVGSEIWFPVTNLRRDFPELMATGRTSAPPPQRVTIKEPVNPVNVGVYRVLAILLGHIGVHDFYAGYVAAGIWKIGLLLLSFFLLSSGTSIFILFGSIFLFGLVAWILYDLIKGPLKE